MSKQFDRTESHITNSLKQHPENMHSVMHELHNLQHHESAAAFKKDVARLNDDLHKQGLLPHLQLSVDDATHKIEVKKTDGSPTQASPDAAPPPQEAVAPPRRGQQQEHTQLGPHGRDHGHRGRHHGKHRQHGDNQEQDQEGQPEDSTSPPGADKSQEGSDRTPRGRDINRDGTDNGAANNAKDSQNLTKEDKEKYLMQRLTSPDGLGLTRAQAAGVIGNLEHESHLNQNYSEHRNADGRMEHNLGIAQWVGKRKRELEQYAGKDSQNFYKQVEFLEHELKGAERSALNHIKATHDTTSAALAFSRWYERPGSPQNSSRVRYARLAYEKYGNGGFDV